MAQGRAEQDARTGSRGGRQHPDTFAFLQATERFLAGAPQDRVAQKNAGTAPLLFDTPDILDRWTIANHGKRSIALRKLDPSQRRRVNSFVALLLDGSSEACEAAAQAALDEYGDPQLVAERLFAPAARILGERWDADVCSFVGVTMGVSLMQRLLRMMIFQLPPEPRRDSQRSALLSPAPGEQHCFGLSVVDDAFRRAGWEVDCCGCGEGGEMLRLASVNAYSVIGISISTERLLPRVSSTIGKLRMRSLNQAVIVIAGGSLAIEKPQAAIDVGFDFVAITARSAVKLSESVLASRAEASHVQQAAE